MRGPAQPTSSVAPHRHRSAHAAVRPRSSARRIVGAPSIGFRFGLPEAKEVAPLLRVFADDFSQACGERLHAAPESGGALPAGTAGRFDPRAVERVLAPSLAHGESVNDRHLRHGGQRVGPGFRFRGMLVEVIHVTPTGDREADIERVTAQVNRGLEKLILRHPEQYLWIHDRYRKSSKSEEPDDSAA